MQGGEQFLVCIRKDRLDDLGFDQVPHQAAKAQRKDNIGGETIKISSKQFYCLKARIESAPLHDEIKLGMSRGRMIELFKDGGGGCIAFDGTDEKLTPKWSMVVNDAQSLMFFGKPFQNFRSFDELFRLRSDVEWSHHIFRQFAAEYKGDARASSLLFAIYNRRQRETVAWKLKEVKAAW